MSIEEIILLVILAAVGAAIIFLLLLPTAEKDIAKGIESISVSSDQGSVVTVRKVGRVTSVTIRGGVQDHWDGEGGVPVPLLPTEATKTHEPELYAEYMDPSTSAIRKYEIIDEVYALGFTLPYIRGLNEAYKKEMKEILASGDPDGRAIHERTPVNLTAAASGPRYEGLDIDDGLRHVSPPDMGEEGPAPVDNP